MDITCGDCGARFRLDRALLKDSNAARIRCRKCGGLIVVRLPGEPPVPAPPVPAAREVVPKEEPASAPRIRQEEISLPPAEEPPAPEKPPGKSAPWLEEAALPPPVEDASPKEPMAFETDISNLFADPPGEDAGPDRIPLSPEEYPAGENPPEETAAMESGRKAPSRPPAMLAVLVISVLWILLLAGGVFYFGTTKSGQDRLGKLIASWGSSRTGSAPARPVYDIRDVKWYVDKDSTAGSLFVIKGSVANVGNAPSAGIRIQATLLGKDNEALAEKAAFAGNLLDEASLRRADRAGIEGVLSNRFGEGNVNREIPKDKALPFMVVFFDPAERVESIMVRAIDAR